MTDTPKIRWHVWLIAFCLTAVGLPSACKKEFSVENTADFPRLPNSTTEPVTIQGLVMDEKGAPMADAAVFADNQTVKTDRYGIFRFEKVPMSLNGGLVTVRKEGYFEGSRSMFYEKTSTNFMRIRMVRRLLSGEVKSTTGGTVKVGDGSILFPENAFRLKSGNVPYTGDAKVFAAFLPANRPATLEEMPGNLYGIRSDSGFAGLETLGMMTVEIEGSNGEPLQLAAGKLATMEIPSPPNAPPVVPMWFFDNASGFWKEEGNAYSSGSKLIAKVSHFSSWNWDLPYPVVTIKARFVTNDGLPLQNYRVLLKRGVVTDNTKLSVMTVTDSTGRIKGPLPVNETVTLSIVSQCDDIVLFSKSVGPVSTETDFGEFTVSLPSTSRMEEISGKLTDCNDQPLKKGFFSLRVGDQSYRASIDASGEFKFRFLNCNRLASATGSGFDIDTFREGDLVNISLNGSAASLGNLKICGTAVQNEFIDYIIGRTSYRIEGPKDSLKAWYVSDTLNIEALSEDKKKLFRMMIKTSPSTGLKPITGLRANQYIFMETMAHSVDITKFGAPGGTVEGSMTATMFRRDTLSPQQWLDSSKVEAIFKVKRRS